MTRDPPTRKSAPVISAIVRFKSHEQQFYETCGRGDALAVEDFLCCHPRLRINWEGSNKWTALHLACYNGHAGVVEVLISLPEIDLNPRTDSHDTPFLLACYQGNLEVVKLLLGDSRCKFNWADEDDRTPIWWATYWGRVKVVQWILGCGRREGVNLHKPGRYWMDQALHTPEVIADKVERTELVWLLEAHRTSVEEGERQAREILGITSFLVQGPDSRLKAATAAKAATTAALLQTKQTAAKAATTAALLQTKQTAKEALQRVYQAVDANDADEVGKILEQTSQLNLNEGRPSDKKMGIEGTVLHIACRKNQPEVVTVLLGHAGVNVNQRNSYGSTPLLTACVCNNVKVVKILLAHPQVDVNITDQEGGSPLWWMAYKGYLEVVELLLASSKEVLLEVPTTCAGVSKTPEQMANSSGHFEVEQLLRGYRLDRGKVVKELQEKEAKRKNTTEERDPEDKKRQKHDEEEREREREKETQ